MSCRRTAIGCLIGAILTELAHGMVGLALADPSGPAITRSPYEQTRQQSSRREPARAAPALLQSAQDYRRLCNKPSNFEEAGLCQQWRMAEASDKMMTFTILGSFILFATLIVTGLAARAAGATAAQAIKANAISQESLLTEQRAWIELTSVRIVSSMKWEGMKGTIRLEFQIANVGKTPALEVSLAAQLRPVQMYFDNSTGVFEQAHKLADMTQKARPISVTIFPGRTKVERWDCSFPDEDRLGARECGRGDDWYKNILVAPLLIVCVDYKLIFMEQHHQTWFVCRIERKGGVIVPSDGEIPLEELVLLGADPIAGSTTN